MNKYKPGTVLENSIGGIAIFNETFAFVSDLLHAKSKVIVLDCLVDIMNPSREFLKVLYNNNKIGFVLNFPDRWKEVK